MPRQYFFWKYFNTIIVLYCILVQKSPIFVQLSPIQCTYSNIFIRFFKFSPANTNIYQNSYRVIGANCAVEIALSGRQCSLLCLFAPFSPRKYKSILRGVNKVSLPGDSHVALLLRMTEKNQTTTLFVFTILFIDFLPYEVLCYCEASPTAMPWQSPGRVTLL